jgi:hypothetical protein
MKFTLIEGTEDQLDPVILIEFTHDNRNHQWAIGQINLINLEQIKRTQCWELDSFRIIHWDERSINFVQLDGRNRQIYTLPKTSILFDQLMVGLYGWDNLAMALHSRPSRESQEFQELQASQEFREFRDYQEIGSFQPINSSNALYCQLVQLV